MGKYNTLSANAFCPSCHHFQEFGFQFRFGFLNWDYYRPGESLRWKDDAGRLTGVPSAGSTAALGSVLKPESCCGA